MNNKLALSAILISSLTAVTLPAQADPGATVVKEFGCQIIPADWGGPGVLFTDDTHSVVTPNGNTNFHCKFDIPAGLEPNKAQKFRDFPCSTLAGITYNTKSVVTPGGQVKLVCQINGSN